MDFQSHEVIAEISVALAGFSGMTAALQRRAQDGFTERDRLALRQMLTWSGLALVFSLLPAVLVELGISPEGTLAACSLGLGSLMLAFSFVVLSRNRRVERAGDRGPFPYLYLIIPIAVFIEIGALLSNGLGLIGPSLGVFQLGLVTCLLVGFIVFAAWLIYRVE